ncbi:MAG: terminase family protein [Oscillospiraceae bacterium]|nr:terminase family protein [Oscillospiraceae bacterium]
MLTAKQNEYIRNAHSRWNLKIGAVRSGKSYVDIAQVIPWRLRSLRDKAGLNLILGVSRSTIERNVLQPMREMYTSAIVGSINSENIAFICGVPVYCLGAEKISQVSKVQGASLKYCYGDEIAKWNPEVFAMLQSRLDKEYSCFDGSCNPEYPGHWLKRFIDREDLDAYIQHYTIFDNPFLPEAFVDALCKEYAGTVYYDRYINGSWARAEGLIYPMVNEANFYDDETRPVALYSTAIRSIACDYGTTNPCVFLDVWDDGDTLWVDREYRWDSQAAAARRSVDQYRTDAQYADDMEKFMGADPAKQCLVIVDPSAKSFITELRQRGLWVKEGDNDVLDGIRRTATLFARRKIRIHKSNCASLIEELQTYIWDEKAGLIGDERPVKAQDHGPDALRYKVNGLPEWRISA